MLSSSWSHKGHLFGRGRRYFARRPAVQHRLCASRHRNIRHLGGAHDFQILSHGSNNILSNIVH
jgi:hypothetical protein